MTGNMAENNIDFFDHANIKNNDNNKRIDLSLLVCL